MTKNETSPNLPVSEVAKIEVFCGDCHALPQPSSFPKHAWRAEVQRGYDFYYASQRSDLEVPVMNATIDYYVEKAPVELPQAPTNDVDPKLVNQFSNKVFSLPDTDHAAISFLDVVELDEPFGRCIVVSDMRSGGVYSIPIEHPTSDSVHFGDGIRLGSVRHPAVVRVADWDQDGRKDFLVADLGTFLPSDTDKGQVVWLRAREDNSFESIPLLTGLGRVASLEVTDLNNDASLDLLVAEFGWHETGSIFWAEHVSGETDRSMKMHRIDNRPGAIHVPTFDINRDGNPDFLALVSQHFETIELFTNDGSGEFQSRTIFRASDPSFGSSGIEITDLNQDGQPDILYTNGDAFDSFVIKPFHSVRWFEGNADGTFEERLLGPLPGAHRAVSGDFNGDGRMDVIAGAFLPRDVLQSIESKQSESIVIWEQTKDEIFARRVLSVEPAIHATILVEDLNLDGRSDIIAGNFREGGTDTGPAVKVWLSK